jgi:pimeloyl-ACP methyl ester carboxylesterase
MLGSSVTAPRIILVHGAATTADVWRRVVRLLPDLVVEAPERPCSGDLEVELDWLAARAAGAVVVGVGGGATLGLALAGRPLRTQAMLLHEPAVGSLVPELLTPMAEAYAAGGVAGFATCLYGSSWQPSMAPSGTDTVTRDLAMFRGFEPGQVARGHGPVVVTVGGQSPPIRHLVAARLEGALGLRSRVLAGAEHFVHHEQPEIWASQIRQVLAETMSR